MHQENICQESNYKEHLAIIGKKVSIARHLRSEKMTSVASALGISHAVISQIENGRYYGLKMVMLIKLSEHLKIPLSDLVEN
jgi:transcriptional regulator with XRE-family HTH domain